MKSIFFNGKFYVERGHFEEAVLIEDGLFKAVGKTEEILAMADADTEKIDCQGKTVIPGLNDSHQHLLLYAMNKNEVYTEDVTSVENLVEVCKKFMAENPEKVANGMHSIGWNQDTFTGEKRFPTKEDLDQISTEIPIVLERICGHIASTNSKAIEVLGVTPETRVAGGEIRLGEDGQPNGVFTENALIFANKAVPSGSKEFKQKLLKEAMEYAVSVGLTTVQSNDSGSYWCKDEDKFSVFEDFYKEGKGLLRYHSQVCFDSPEDFEKCLTEGEYARYRKEGGYGKDSWLTLGPLKLFKDGSLGARTAITDSYVGQPDNHGVEAISIEEADRYCEIAKKYGVQVVTHCIGDIASDEIIGSYEKAFIDGENKLRHSLVHCQLTTEKLLDRIVEEDILVQAQPVFLGFDMSILEDTCGKEMAETSYNFGTLLKRGAHLSYGTDCPVEDCNPFPNIYMAVTRKNMEGKPEGGFYPKECVDVETAIDAYTVESAYCEFKEDVKGRIKPGFYADMVVIDKDIFTCDPLEIKDIKPEMTVVGGKIVYKK